MVITTGDVQLRLSGGPANTDPNQSLGGAKSSQVVIAGNLDNLFDDVSNAEQISSVVGRKEYRCAYIHNSSPNNQVLQDLEVFLITNTTSPNTYTRIAAGLDGYGTTAETAVANETTPPANVAWTFARIEGEGCYLGNVNPNEHVAFWIERTAGPAQSGTSYRRDTCILGIKVRKVPFLTAPPPAPPGPPSPPPAPPPIGGDSKLTVSTVTCDAEQTGNECTHVNDANAATRWSAADPPHWVKLDLGSTKEVAFCRILWYNPAGNERTYTFVVETSTDNTTFPVRYSGTSPTGENMTTYEFTNVDARYVRLSISAATPNNSNQFWAGVREFEIWGQNQPIGSPPPPPPSPTSSDGTTDHDIFGVRMLYQTNNDINVSAPWYINMNAIQNPTAGDCRLSYDGSGNITKNSDGSFRISSDSNPALLVYSSGATGCVRDSLEDNITGLDTFDHSVWAGRGHILNAKDFVNIEATIYLKLNSASDTEDQWIFVRQARRGDGLSNGCEAVAYRCTFQPNGKDFGFEKQFFQNASLGNCGNRVDIGTRVDATGSLEGKYVGLKFIIYNFASNTKVHLEWWIDESGSGIWKKLTEFEDVSGNFPGSEETGSSCDGDEPCGGIQDQVLTWGAPKIRWLFAKASSYDFKWMSVREIIPPKT